MYYRKHRLHTELILAERELGRRRKQRGYTAFMDEETGC